MYQIQMFVPVFYSNGNRVEQSQFEEIQTKLLSQFGGVTAFLQNPVDGEWKDDNGSVSRDQLVIFEIMAEQIDRPWWRSYRETLEKSLDQIEILIRSTQVEKL